MKQIDSEDSIIVPNDTPEDNSASSMQPVMSNLSIEEHQSENEPIEQEQADAKDPLLSKYHLACQQGDLATVKEMIENGVIDLKHDYDDVERVSGLHWASINNRLSVVRYLISKDVDVNFQGGELNATPLHWAARYGYVYIVDYLLEHGADPSVTDAQGFNLLHLSINSSNIMLVIYVLFFVIDDKLDIDCVDPNGRTALLWAAYQGDSLSVETLLKFRASVKATDKGGFTPLHWGTVKGQAQVLKHLIENGADFFQKTADGKNCFAIAHDMNTTGSLVSALYQCGFDKEGFAIPVYFKKSLHAKLVTFFAPWIFIGVLFKCFASIHPIFSLIFSILLGLGMRYTLKKYVIPAYAQRNTRQSFLKTPFLAGVFSGSVFWASYTWLTRIMPLTLIEEPIANLLFFAGVALLASLFVKLVRSDPGLIPEETDHSKVKETIKELLSVGKFDAKHFCISTWVRKPIRSKFSNFSKALVTRFDHFCPWIYNDIGLRNHKTFLFFILCLETCIFIFLKLCMEYFDVLEDSFEDDYDLNCGIFGEDLCAGFFFDTFTFLVLAWTCFQGIWVGFLTFVQLFQTAKGVTNYEFSTLSKRRHNHDSSVNEYFTTTPLELIDEEEADPLNPVIPGNNPRDPLMQKSRTCFGICWTLTGLDQFVMVIKETFGVAQREEPRNNILSFKISTDYGWKTNLKDFWLTSDITAPIWQRFLYSPSCSKALLNGEEVDYFKLYKLPERHYLAEEIV